MAVGLGVGGFGCVECMPDAAEDAWRARQGMAVVAALVEDVHVSVRILACGACGQHFVSVFTERIDWVGGEDPQDWAVLPLTADESGELRAGSSTLELGAIGVGRRCLRRAYPSDGDVTVGWSTGPVWIGPYG